MRPLPERRCGRRVAWLSLLLGSALVQAQPGPAPRIVGGDDVTTDIPWMAGLHDATATTVSRAPFCGGSLIAPGWVLTAAHCLTDPGLGANPANYFQQPARTAVRIDRPNLSDLPQFAVEALIAHPDYGIRDGDSDSDIALVKLATPALGVATVSLADEPVMTLLETSTLLDEVVTLIGWGVYDGDGFSPNNAESGPQPDRLQSVRVDYLPFRDRRCNRAWGGLTDNMICAWEPAPPASDLYGEDACFGDSGGPMLLPAGTRLSSGTVTDDWLLGATSFGSSRCNSRKTPGVYTRLANFPGWIEQVTASEGDPLIDLRVALALPPRSLPGNPVSVTAELANNSVLNASEAATLDITAADTTLTTTDPGCAAITDGWRCTAPVLAPGASHSISLNAQWNGADHAAMTVLVEANDSRDDYRRANNRVNAISLVSSLPDIALSAADILENGNRRARIRFMASNAGLVDATGVVLVLTVPAGLTITDEAGCVAVAVNQRECVIGPLASGAQETLDLTLAGEGTFLLGAELQSANGDGFADDTRRSLLITLKAKSSFEGGGASWLLLALLYRRRRARNQVSS